MKIKRSLESILQVMQGYRNQNPIALSPPLFFEEEDGSTSIIVALFSPNRPPLHIHLSEPDYLSFIKEIVHSSINIIVHDLKSFLKTLL